MDGEQDGAEDGRLRGVFQAASNDESEQDADDAMQCNVDQMIPSRIHTSHAIVPSANQSSQ